VQGVPEPARSLIAVALAGCALAGCGDDGAPSKPEPPPGLPAGFNIQIFDCADWNAAGPEVRRYVLDEMHEIGNDQVSGPGVQGRGSVLTDEQATAMFDSTCRSPRARGFVLYKIYAFSRGFRGGQPGR
jgi:hypothetical protein